MRNRNAWIIGGALLGLTRIAAICAARRRSFSFRGRTVVITGGSRGLGLVMARVFAQLGARLALLARDKNELQRAEAELRSCGANVLTIPCDLRDRKQIEQAVQRIAAQCGRIDVLINNAGIIEVGPFEHMTPEDFENAMAIHFFAPLFMTLAVLPHLRRVKEGRIVNIASIGGKIAVPHLLPYSASKFALVGFSDGLRSELRHENILVTTVCPGLMRTGSPGNATFKGRYRNEYAWFSISGSLPLISLDAERAARKIVSACRRGAPRIVLGLPAKAAAVFNELFPGIAARLLAQANDLLPKASPNTGNARHSGWESRSRVSESFLTLLTDRAALRNNEYPVSSP
jgi:short-subunit dehydrogenase